MNHIYRVIWNAVSSTWTAVAETARGHGKSTKAAIHRRGVAALGVLTLIPPFVLAQVPSVVVSPGSNLNAYVAPNGVTVVNINQSNAAGLSHNQYQNFNVNANGLILNNTTSAQIAYQSQLAGQVTANFNQVNTARVILNEVVSNNRSQLAGFTEVLGGRADVVLANPYGITCSGCGFINTDRVTLSTGNPFLASNGGLGGFSVGQGDILITGTGLNATAQQVLDMVTRSVRIDAPVNGQDVGIAAGANRWSYDTRAVTGAATPTGSAPVHSIDTAVLGGMYANRIRMTSTEAGVGVRMLGDAAASAGDFTLTAAGRIELQNRISASTDLSVGTTAIDTNALALTDASLTSTGKTTLAAAGGTRLAGSALVAGTDLAVSAASLLDTASASGMANNNLRRAGGALSLAVGDGASLGATHWSAAGAWNGTFGNLVTTGATQLYSGNGTLIASADKGDLALGLAALQSAGNMALSATGQISTAAGTGQGVQSLGGNLSLTAGNGISNAGTVSADKGAVRVRADGAITNSGQIHAAQNLDIADQAGGASANLSNSGVLLTEKALVVQAATMANTAAARVQAQTGSVVNAHRIDNTGTWLLSQQADANDQLTVRGAFTNSGTLQGAGAVVVGADSVTNSGTLIAGTDLAVSTAADFTNSGTAQATGTLGVASGGDVSNTSAGVLKAARLNLDAGKDLVNAGVATADSGNATLRVDGTLANSGELHALGNMDIAARNGAATQAVINSGKLLAEQALVLKATSFSNTATGWAQAATGSTATLDTLDNAGTWLLSKQAAAQDQIAVAGTANNSGTLQSAGDLDVTAASVVNSGAVLAAGQLDASTVGSLNNTAGGAMQAGTALTLTGQSIGNAATATLVGQRVAVNAGNGFSNAGALQASAGAATLRVSGTLDNSGTVHATGNIDIADRAGAATQAVTNSGTLLTDQALVLTAANMANTATGRVQAYTGSTVAASRLDNAGIWLLSQQGAATDTVSVTNTLTNSGTLQSAGSETLTADQITNTGTLIAEGNLSANVTSSLDNQATGVVQAGQQLAVHGAGAALTNAAGGKMLGDGLAIDVASIDNSGTLQGGTRADSMVSAATTLTNRTTGVLSVATASGGAGTVAATTLVNDGKLQSAGALTLHVGASGLSSNGTVVAERDLTLQSRTGNHYTATVNGLMQSRSGTLAIHGTGSSALNIGATGTAVGQQLTAALGTINLANGATLSSDRDMTLTLGALNLAGANSAVLGSTDQAVPSQTKITTTSTLNNKGLLFSGNDLTVNAPSITNGLTGGIAALHDLRVTATSGNLLNQGALYAGNVLNASAVSGTLTNAASLTAFQGTISAEKAVNLNANTLVNNSTIDSKGSVTVTANTLRNEVLGGDTRQYGALSARVKRETDYQSYYDFPDDHEKWFYEEVWYKDQVYAGGKPTVKPQITGVGAVQLNFNVGKNLGGVISGDTVTLTGTGSGASFVNDDLALHRTTYTRTWTEHTKWAAKGPAKHYDRRVEDDIETNKVTENSNIGAGVYARMLNGSNFALTNNGSTSAQTQDIKKGTAKSVTVQPLNGGSANKGSVQGALTEVTGAVAGTVTPVTTLSGQPTVSFVAVNVANGVSGNTFGGISITLPANPNGLYVVAREPGAKYLVESNPRFQIGSSTVGSDYLSKLLGYDADALARRLGDASYEAYLIKQQLVAQTGNVLLKGAKDASAQVQSLMDSAAGESKALGLAYGQALTPEQQARLKHDIVWMVQTEVNGQVVLAPVVYLSPKTKSNITQGAVITAETANLSLSSLTNTGGTIAGSQSLKVTSVGDVVNTSGTIKGGNVAITSTQGSIVNQTTASGSGNELRYVTDIGKTASIQSTGTLALDAAKDITNTGSSMAAGGDASLKAGGNVTFDTIQDKSVDTTHSTFKQGGATGMTTTTTTTVTQVKSGLSSGGNLSIDAGKDITLAGTNTRAAGNADLKAGGDLNMLARENTTDIHSESKASGFGMNGSLYGSTTVTTDSTSVRNVGSTLQVGGNASLAAGNDITVQGSSVDVKGSGTVSATNVNVLAGRNYDETTTTTKNTGVLQVSASSGRSTDTKSEAEAASGKTKSSASASASAGASAEATGTGSAGLAFSASTTTTAQTTDLKHVGSRLNFGGDLTVDARNDVTLQGSTVKAGGDATVNAKNVNLLAAEDKATSTSTTTSTSIGLMASTTNKAKAEAKAEAKAGASYAGVNASAGASAEASVSTENKLDLMQRSVTTNSTLDTKNQGSTISAGKKLAVNATDTIQLQGSNLASGGDMDIKAKDMKFVAVNDVHETSSSSNVTTAGLYADAGASVSAKASGAASLGAQAGASAQVSASGSVGIYAANEQSQKTEGKTTAITSGLSAGGNMTRHATNSITDVGTQISAGGDLNQTAKTITSLAAADTTYSSSSSNSNSAKLGVYGAGSQGHSVQASVGPGSGKQPASKEQGAGIKAEYRHEDASAKSATSNAVVSSIKVGGSVNSQSSGTTKMEGTSIDAGRNVALGASSLDYSAAKNTASSSGNSTSAGGSVGVDVVNKSVSVSADYTGNKSSESSSNAVVGGIRAGGNLDVTTSGDTRFEGTQLSAGGAATVAVGGNLKFDAAKDTSSSSSQKTSAALDVTVGKKEGSGAASVGYAKASSSSSKDVVGGISSGGPLTIQSGGDATFTGTQIASGGDAKIAAGGNLALNAAHDTSSSQSLGVDVSGAGAKGGVGTGRSAAMKKEGAGAFSVGDSKSSSDTATGAGITSGGRVQLSSGKDTTLEGTQVKATNGIGIVAGGAVNLADAKSTSSSVGVAVGASASGYSMTPVGRNGQPVVRTPPVTPGKAATPNPTKGSGLVSAQVDIDSSSSSQATSLKGGASSVSITSGAANPATAVREIKAQVPVVPLLVLAGKMPVAKTADGKPLPAWLTFDPRTGSFSGKPPADFKGNLKVNVAVPQLDGSTKTVPMNFSGQ